MEHKAGFVNIIGKPNVGKSTLMNALTGEQLSVVNAKAQTTRHRIKGIINGDDYQIIFSDTPGIMKPAYKLHEKMLNAVKDSFEDADILIYVAEINERGIEESVKQQIENASSVKFLVLNKIDTVDQEKLEKAIEHWKQFLKWDEIIPVSALHQFNTPFITEKILAHLPESPPYYDKEVLTDRNERFFVTEIIREKILSLYRQEIPYSVEVAIEYFKEDKDLTRIGAIIFVERESQKAIILGNKGEAIKKLGTEARKKIEEFVGRKIFLGLTVKVNDNWRDNENSLKRFGY